MKTAFFQMVTVPICVKKTVEEGDSFSYKKLMGFFKCFAYFAWTGLLGQ